jgi:hypothetical protein
MTVVEIDSSKGVEWLHNQMLGKTGGGQEPRIRVTSSRLEIWNVRRSISYQ